MVDNKVRERRKELGMTLKQLSEDSGLAVSTLSEIELGREPGVKTAQKIAHALNKSIDELWPD